MRALVVSNMQPDERHPGRGCFVRDQVRSLDRIPGVEVELFEFPPGPRALARAAIELRRRYRGQRFDVVHAHFGLTAWPALAVAAERRVLTAHGTDLRHPRTRALTKVIARRMWLLAGASASLARELPEPRRGGHLGVLPCGVDLERLRPRPRTEARAELGLSPGERFVLFPADPERAVKRFDRARRVADGLVALHPLGHEPPQRMALWINAADAVLVPSESEGFGLAVLEALACDVPVLATPVGVHPLVLDGIDGALCAPFEEASWRAGLAQVLEREDPRVAGRARAALFSAEAMAARVAAAWTAGRAPLDAAGPGGRPGSMRA